MNPMGRWKPGPFLLLLLTVSVACRSTSPVPLELRVLSYNVKHGLGMDGRLDLTRTAELIRRLEPDLVVLQEIDNGVERSGGTDQMAVLSELTGLQAAFGAFMPYQGGQYGMGLMSRLPIVETENHRLPEGAEPRSALAARVRLPGGGELVLCNVHLYASQEQRLAQARELASIYEDLEDPMVLAGDFNSEPGSVVMELVEEHWTQTDKGLDRLTFPSDRPEREIDFLLFRPRGRFEVVSVDVLDEPLVSDHRPLLAVLRLGPAEPAR